MPSASWLNGWVTGDVVTTAEFKKGVGCIFDSTLSVAAASIDTLAIIPGGYAGLQIDYVVRSVGSPGPWLVAMTFNADAVAGHYGFQTLSATGTTVSTAASAGTETYGRVGICAGAGLAAASFSVGRIVIPNYAAGVTEARAWTYESGYADTVPRYEAGNGAWSSSVPITRVALSNSGGNLAIGSRMTVHVLGS